MCIRDSGTTTTDGGLYVKAVSANPETGLVAVQTKSNKDASGCFGVLDAAASIATTVWESCDYSLGAFSPDGRHVLASSSYLSGDGPTSLAILDARTGAPVATFEPSGRTMVTLRGVVWESPETVVAVATQATTTSVVRFGLDGTLEETVDAVEGDPYADLPFYLGLDRRRGF